MALLINLVLEQLHLTAIEAEMLYLPFLAQVAEVLVLKEQILVLLLLVQQVVMEQVLFHLG